VRFFLDHDVPGEPSESATDQKCMELDLIWDGTDVSAEALAKVEAVPPKCGFLHANACALDFAEREIYRAWIRTMNNASKGR
jgi:hypothetical protein